MDGAWDTSSVYFIFGAHIYKQKVFILLFEGFEIAVGDFLI